MSLTISRLGRRLRLGVIGGGPGSFIGPVPNLGSPGRSFRDCRGGVVLQPERSRQYGREIGLAADRAYGSPADLFASEAARPDGIDAVSIMTPNDSHCALAHAAIDAGLDVICDNPLATSLPDCS